MSTFLLPRRCFSRMNLKKTLEKEQIIWRSWWDQGSPDGPIQTRWEVTERPAIYVLDARGVIRFKDLKGDELDKAVDSLLQELEGEPIKR